MKTDHLSWAQIRFCLLFGVFDREAAGLGSGCCAPRPVVLGSLTGDAVAVKVAFREEVECLLSGS
jgi:hypothetical protein